MKLEEVKLTIPGKSFILMWIRNVIMNISMIGIVCGHIFSFNHIIFVAGGILALLLHFIGLLLWGFTKVKVTDKP